MGLCAGTCHESWAYSDSHRAIQPGLLVPPENKRTNNLIPAGNSPSPWKQGIIREVACTLQTCPACSSSENTKAAQGKPGLCSIPSPAPSPAPSRSRCSCSARSSRCSGDTTRPTAATAALPPGSGAPRTGWGCFWAARERRVGCPDLQRERRGHCRYTWQGASHQPGAPCCKGSSCQGVGEQSTENGSMQQVGGLLGTLRDTNIQSQQWGNLPRCCPALGS